jgi:hypothetical protein
MTYLLLVVAFLILGLGLMILSPTLPAVLALPGSYALFRLGGAGGGNNLSVADALLIVATFSVLPTFHWDRIRNLKPLLALMVVYEACTALSVMFNPNRHDIIEWFHQIFLVGGSMIVGYALVERGRSQLAMKLFALVSMVLSVAALADFAAHGFSPIPGFGPLQKNALGVMFVIAALCAYLNPPWIGFSPRFARVTLLVCLGGVLGSFSRQAMIALVVVVVIFSLRPGTGTRQSRLLVLGVLPLAVVAYVTVQKELSSRAPITSFSYRTQWYSQAVQIWRGSPAVGVGERFWYNKHSPLKYQPPNAEISMLATGGVIGLIGFVVLVLGTLILVWRYPREAGSLGAAVLLAHAIEGQFDIYWVAATGSVPWIIAGMSAAWADRLARARSGPAAEPEPEAPTEAPPQPRFRPTGRRPAPLAPGAGA